MSRGRRARGRDPRQRPGAVAAGAALALAMGAAACGGAVGPSADGGFGGFLFPNARQRDLALLCDTLHGRADFTGKPFVKHLPPLLLNLSEETVTYYFANNYSYTVPRPDSVTLPPGSYPCQ